ncbi:MAG: PASTA domain-containing protein [bacterium]
MAAALAQQKLAPKLWPAPMPCGGAQATTRAGGKTRVVVPGLQQYSVQQAVALAAKYGLNVEERSVRQDGTPNVVVSQSPPPKTIAARGDTVVVCWLRAPVIPYVLNVSFAAAQRTLADSGYLALPIDVIVGKAVKTGTVLRQSPRYGLSAALGSTDTLYVGVAPPPPQVQMPNLRGFTDDDATSALDAVLRAGQLKLPIGRRAVNGQSFDPRRSLVDSQRPDFGTVLSAGQTIELMFRDTTTPVPMPYVVGREYNSARATLRTVFQRGNLKLKISPRSVDGRANFATSIVESQAPDSGTTLSPQSDVQLVVRDTATIPVPPPPPPRQTLRMPRLIGSSVDAAIDTLNRLYIIGGFTPKMDTRGVNGSTYTHSRAIVDSQFPAAGDSLTLHSDVRVIVRDKRPFPWWWIIAGIALAGLGSAAAWMWPNPPLPPTPPTPPATHPSIAALNVVPYPDIGNPRVVLTTRRGETADDAFARLGLSFNAVADPGTQRLHEGEPPRAREETNDA